MSECVGKREENTIHLEELPTEVLLTIFKYCNLNSLGNLCQTCKRLNFIIADFIWYSRGQKSIATNQISQEIRRRSTCILSPNNKCRIGKNWVEGRYVERIYYPFKSRRMPWLILEHDKLWLSRDQQIRAFRRKPHSLESSSFITLKGHSEDICRFVETGELIVSGGREGCVYGWTKDDGRLKFRHEYNEYISDVAAVGVCKDVVVSGLENGTLNVTRFSKRLPDLSLNLRDRIWSLAVQPLKDLCCVGTAGYYKVPSLHLYNLERGQEAMKLEQTLREGAGVLDIHWESPHEFLSGGYDTYMRLWDIRTGRCELSWEDPYDCVIYSIASDCAFTMICGMALHARVQLWDKRQRHCVTKYFLAAKRTPVYTVSFDSCHLAAAVDLSLHLVDFDVFKTTPGVNKK